MVIGRIIRGISAAAKSFRRLYGDRSGIAAVEFALLLPVMLTLYIGGVQISDGFTVKRKVTNATSALGDLVARTEEISKSEMENILDAAEAVVAPYSASNLKLKLLGVSINSKSEPKVVWAAARHEAVPSKGTAVPLPDGVKLPDTFVIVAEVHYIYTPTIGYVFTGSFDISERFYLKPRLSSTVCYDGVCS
jgi:Flp pilus assembly protein TadG